MGPDRYEFGDVTVDFRRMEVRRGEEVVAIEPKAFDLLRYLIENRDRLVTKDELLETVWKDTFVTPNVLTRAIAQLRKALGDLAFEARYIETVSKRGYRFIAPLVVPGAAGLETAAPAEAIVRPPPPHGRWVFIVAASAVAMVAVIVAQFWSNVPNPGPSEVSESQLSPKRVSVATDSHTSPAISHDGRVLAYASERNGAMEIYAAELSPGSPEMPLTSDGGQNVHPSFSPDGRWLAYHSRTRGGIWVAPATGGASRQVADFGSMPRWSPDSDTIVFTSDAGGLSSQALLWTVGRDGTRLTTLTRLGNPPGGHLAPAWSNDGRLIVFRVGQHAQSDLWMMDVAKGVPWLLATDPSPEPARLTSDDRPFSPSFAPDDRSVYWIGHNADGNDYVMRISLDDEGRGRGSPERVLPFTGKSVTGLSIARDGTAVFALNDGSTNLYAIDVGRAQASAQPRQLTNDDAANSQPDYGPAGRVAYEHRVVGQPISVWTIGDDGKQKELLSAELPMSLRAPQWDAAGKRLFVHINEPGANRPHFGWLDVDPRQLTRLALPLSITTDPPPQLSPDGKRLVFHVIASDGVMNLWTAEIDGGPSRQITFDREAMSYPRWSQDGRAVAMVIKRGDQTHVGVVSAEGGPVEQLTSDSGQSWPHSFSPDNERIAFAGLRNGVWNIYTVSRRAKAVEQLTHFTTAEGHVRYPAWSPRGDRIVFERAARKGSLWMVKLPS